MANTYYGMTEEDLEWLARSYRYDSDWAMSTKPKVKEEEKITLRSRYDEDDFTEEEGILLGIYTGHGLFQDLFWEDK